MISVVLTKIALNFAFKAEVGFCAEFRFVFDSSDGRVVRASALVAADLGLISSRVKPMILKFVFTTSLLDA